MSDFDVTWEPSATIGVEGGVSDFLVIDFDKIRCISPGDVIREGGCLLLVSKTLLSDDELDELEVYLKNGFGVALSEEMQISQQVFLTVYRRGRDCRNVDKCTERLVAAKDGVCDVCEKESRYSCPNRKTACTAGLCHACFLGNRFIVSQDWDCKDYADDYLRMKKGAIVNRLVKSDSSGWSQGFLDGEHVAKWFPPDFVR